MLLYSLCNVSFFFSALILRLQAQLLEQNRKFRGNTFQPVHDVLPNSSLTERENELAVGFKKYEKGKYNKKTILVQWFVKKLLLYFQGKMGFQFYNGNKKEKKILVSLASSFSVAWWKNGIVIISVPSNKTWRNYPECH